MLDIVYDGGNMDIKDRLTVERLNDSGCINLLGFMLKRMSREFKHSYRGYLLDPSDIKAYMQYRQVRNEFLSEYFHDLTNLDGKRIVRRLEAIVRQDVEQCA